MKYNVLNIKYFLLEKLVMNMELKNYIYIYISVIINVFIYKIYYNCKEE